MRDDVDWVAMAPEVARRLKGEPDLKTKREWRWGEGGSVRLNLARGAFTDFENGVSGGPVAMVMYVLRMDRAEALEWLWSEGLLPEGRSLSRRPDHTRRPKPVAEILKHPMGSVRDMLFTDDALAALQRYADTDDPIPESYQMNLPGLEPESVIRPAKGLPLLDRAGMQTKIRKGRVSHTVRIFLEVIMALEEGQDRATIRCTLGNLADYLYPDGKFKKRRQLEHIHKGLHDLHVNAYVPFMDPASGQLRPWRPVTVTTSLAPSDDEDSIFFDVILPPDARQGPRVLKEAVRATGKRSAPQFNAYLAAADVIDRYGEQNGEIIDPARPAGSGNERRHLIDGEDGATDAEEDGTPAARPYRPDAVAAMKSGRNPKADRYPVVSFSDLIRACWPGVDVRALTPATKREKVTHAKKHWKALEQDGHIRIEALAEGWRILPSEKHVRTYRALMHQKRHPPRVEPAS